MNASDGNKPQSSWLIVSHTPWILHHFDVVVKQFGDEVKNKFRPAGACRVRGSFLLSECDSPILYSTPKELIL